MPSWTPSSAGERSGGGATGPAVPGRLPGRARGLRPPVRGTIRDVTPTSPVAFDRPETPAPPADPTHGCARCGARVPMDVGLCEECNPLGLRDVSASQVHGTVFITVLVGFVLLAVFARLAVTGLGPFPATLDRVDAAGTGLEVTITVTNEGTASGQTTCRVSDPTDRGGGRSAFVLSPPLDPSQTLTFSKTVTELGNEVRELAVECRQP